MSAPVRICAQQYKCPGCGKWKAKKKFQRHETCSDCRSPAQQQEDLPDSPPAAAASAPPPLFPPHAGNRAPLPTVQRAAIVVLDKQGLPRTDIAQQAGTSLPTVRHWLRHYEQKHDVADERRSGRPRCTDEAADINIAVTARVEPHLMSPGIKRKLDLSDVSVSTIKRRCVEAGLPGQISRHVFQLTDEHKRKRLSFAGGYQRWTEDDWCKAIFSDEKIFLGYGRSGQRRVRRPVGEATNPAYSVP
ncbi:MAG: helix-turn-helix domain-containing protein, partial [Acidobacteriaceae bacterium]|nr:helix-turn-helix domain-containing protein [Acidobacteriaceae bacterium]